MPALAKTFCSRSGATDGTPFVCVTQILHRRAAPHGGLNNTRASRRAFQTGIDEGDAKRV